jgi:uncharacterized protein (DUF1015 family)
MADVRPFHGIRFNPARVPDLGAVLCPPFDIISPEEQSRLYAKEPHNIVRVELTKEEPGRERYAQAAETMRAWRASGILMQEKEQAYYLAEHDFLYRGKTMTRLELTAAVKLEDSPGAVKPHEDTRKGPKEDRLKLMTATEANVSPIMLLYQASPMAREVLQKARATAKPLAVELGGGERFRLWPVTNPVFLAALQHAFAQEFLYIADGHHRYETSLYYSKQHQGKGVAAGYVLATLIAFDDPGLLSLPYHRVLRNLDAGAMAKLQKAIQTHFTIERQAARGSAEAIAGGILDSLAKDDVLFEVWGMERGQRWTLRLKDTSAVQRIAGVAHSTAWAGLGATVFRELVLLPTLGTKEEEAEKEGRLTFAKDATEAVEMVNAGGYQAAFLPHAVPMAALKEVSDRTERMPPKATYFHPKLPTGLVMKSLAGGL